MKDSLVITVLGMIAIAIFTAMASYIAVSYINSRIGVSDRDLGDAYRICSKVDTTTNPVWLKDCKIIYDESLRRSKEEAEEDKNENFITIKRVAGEIVGR